MSLTDPIITGRALGATGNSLRANSWQMTAVATQFLSTTVAANPLILRAMEWNAHKAFRLLKRAQLHLGRAKAVRRSGFGCRWAGKVGNAAGRPSIERTADAMRCNWATEQKGQRESRTVMGGYGFAGPAENERWYCMTATRRVFEDIATQITNNNNNNNNNNDN